MLSGHGVSMGVIWVCRQTQRDLVAQPRMPDAPDTSEAEDRSEEPIAENVATF